MNRMTAQCLIVSVIFGCSVDAMSHTIDPITVFYKELHYWGSDPYCEKRLGNAYFHARFIANFSAETLIGSVYVSLSNSDSTRPPIVSDLTSQGDSDRYAFSTYYTPYMPIMISHRQLGLYGIILNICKDQHAQKQAALLIELPSGRQCIVSTPIWNACE